MPTPPRHRAQTKLHDAQTTALAAGLGALSTWQRWGACGDQRSVDRVRVSQLTGQVFLIHPLLAAGHLLERRRLDRGRLPVTDGGRCTGSGLCLCGPVLDRGPRNTRTPTPTQRRADLAL